MSLGTYSQFNTINGDILHIGLQMKINNQRRKMPGDNASAYKFFNLKETSELAFLY